MQRNDSLADGYPAGLLNPHSNVDLLAVDNHCQGCSQADGDHCCMVRPRPGGPTALLHRFSCDGDYGFNPFDGPTGLKMAYETHILPKLLPNREQSA